MFHSALSSSFLYWRSLRCCRSLYRAVFEVDGEKPHISYLTFAQQLRSYRTTHSCCSYSMYLLSARIRFAYFFLLVTALVFISMLGKCDLGLTPSLSICIQYFYLFLPPFRARSRPLKACLVWPEAKLTVSLLDRVCLQCLFQRASARITRT